MAPRGKVSAPMGGRQSWRYQSLRPSRWMASGKAISRGWVSISQHAPTPSHANLVPQWEKVPMNAINVLLRTVGGEADLIRLDPFLPCRSFPGTDTKGGTAKGLPRGLLSRYSNNNRT